jgi:murein L,D-transpeptidase YcbB/YkuD
VNAIKKFQKAEGITADGIYGKNSHDKAYAYKKKVNPRRANSSKEEVH